MKVIIKKAAVEDAKAVANLAIQMWKSNTMEELTESYVLRRSYRWRK